MSRISRRRMLTWSGVVVGSIALPTAGIAAWVWTNADRSNLGRVHFGQPLAIPPLAEPERDAEGRLAFDLHLREGAAELLPGRRTQTWGVNGDYLGPTLRGRRGETVAMRVHNALPEPTTLHWHGMELPAAMDGGPHQMIAPGETWTPSWTIDQPAATLWYHPHPHGETAGHVYRGVAGLFLVDEEQDTGLPHAYGVDDIPLIVQDKSMTEDGQLDFSGLTFQGIDIVGLLGSEILVNGTWGPVLEVTATRVRFRILNASNARVYRLAFEDGRSFHLVGADAGLLPAPLEVNEAQISPGERIEIVAAFRAGETVRLVSRPPDLHTNVVYDRLAGGDDAFALLELRAAPSLAPSPPLPAELPAAPAIMPSGAGIDRAFELGDFTINGMTMDMQRIDFAVPLGRVETWEIHNAQDLPHNLHVHTAAFHVLDVDGDEPWPVMRGRKDTVFVPPHRRVRLALAFGQFADPRTPYMVHCHLLAHEDAGMMQQFVIIEPGGEAALDMTLPATPHAHE